MQEKITIEGNRPVEILDGLKSIEVLKEWSILDNTRTRFEVVFNTPQPTFSVGMRVECTEEAEGFTFGMVYRIFQIDSVGYYILNDKGISSYYHNSSSKYFTPYEKPKEGEECCIMTASGCRTTLWSESDYDELWNLGLAFKEKKQAEFARERLSKLF